MRSGSSMAVPGQLEPNRTLNTAALARKET
jgi:hypothetical protein